MYCWVEVSDKTTRSKFPSLTVQFARQPCDERNVSTRSNLDCVLKLSNRFAELKTTVPDHRWDRWKERYWGWVKDDAMVFHLVAMTETCWDLQTALMSERSWAASLDRLKDIQMDCWMEID
eukprot:gene37812-biopygen29971